MDKQIEKLAKELDYCETHDCIGESCAKCRAIWLIDNGYRKIPEGDVVLSRETWLEIQNYKYNLGFQTGTQIARKQAVKEVLERLKSNCVANGKKNPLMGARVTEYEIDEIAKEMGVEL